ncbi:MAG: hypothetical protein E2O78_08705 [Caldithrix sp.]|nr:MAG: hypothetical protein E2O78_08705 [Caldithrix sp.]
MAESETRVRQLPATIQQVVERLDEIIDESRQENSRLGYFPALYREVTIKVQEGVAGGDFEDGARMERLDVIFANRYLEAYEQYRNGREPTRSWQIALASARRWRLLIIQHLLLGMNAHINLDLGIAAARTNPGENIASLKSDFHKINEILADLLGVVQDKINALSPAMGLLDKVGGRSDEAIMNFSMQKARDEAWKFATALAVLPEDEQQAKIAEKDEKIALLANIVRNPGWLVNLFAFLIRILETSNVRKVINVLF